MKVFRAIAMLCFFLAGLATLAAQIDTLPYAQNFDGVAAPALPAGWSAIVQTTDTQASVAAYTYTNYSPPNSVRLYRFTDPDAVLLLVAPALAPSFPIDLLRIKYQLKGWPDTPVLMGIMSDPGDPSTFVQLGQVNGNMSSWTLVTFDLSAYQGTGRHIAFRHGMGYNTSSLYIDDFLVEYIPANDLAAGELSGELLVRTFEPISFDFQVRNIGSATQSNYSVRLMEGDAMLCEVPGTTLAPGEQTSFTLTTTLDLWGDYFFQALVHDPGDANPENNSSQPFHFLAVDEQLFTIGNGGEQYTIPFDTFWRNSVYQMVIPVDEFEDQFVGLVFDLFWYGIDHMVLGVPIQVWLAGTLSNDLEEGWIPITEMDLVFDGVAMLQTRDYALRITLDEPFAYYGGNLVMLVYHPVWPVWAPPMFFRAQTVGTNRSRKVVGDSIIFDINNLPLPVPSQLSGRYPQTVFGYDTPTCLHGSVEVSVSDQNGQPVPGAAVRFLRSSYILATDAAGCAGFPSVLPYLNQIRVTKPGYLPVVLDVNIVPGGLAYVSCTLISTENDDPAVVPTAPQLSSHPNPFRHSTCISYDLKEAGAVILAIYNARGQLVRTLVSGNQEAGSHRAEWNGRDESGQEAGAGIYFLQLTAGKSTRRGRMLLLK